MVALSAFLSFAHAAQGYGYISSIPAFYGLWWVSPELLNGYIQMSMHQQIEEICSWSSDNWFMKEFVRQVRVCEERTLSPLSLISHSFLVTDHQDVCWWRRRPGLQDYDHAPRGVRQDMVQDR